MYHFPKHIEQALAEEARRQNTTLESLIQRRFQTALTETTADEQRELRQNLPACALVQSVDKALKEIHDALYILDTNWNFIYVNRRAGILLHQKPDELIGQNLWDAFPAAVDTRIHTIYHNAMQKQETIIFTEFYQPLETWFEVRVYPFDGGLSVLFRDITTAKHREEQIHNENRELEQRIAQRTKQLHQANYNLVESYKFLQSVLDSQTTYILVIDASGDIVMVNQAWRDAANRNNAPPDVIEGIGLNYFDVCEQAPEGSVTATIVDNLKRLIHGEDTHYTREYHFPTPSGENWFRLQAVRFDYNDEPQIVISHHNITEIKCGQVKAQTALRKERELNELRAGFLSLVSHEFRTPIAVIQTSVDLLNHYDQKLNADKRQNQLNKIQDQIKRLTAMLEDIRFVHQAESGKHVLEYTPLNIHQYLTTVIEEQRAVINYTGDISVRGDADETLLLDESLLHQIAANLISNAMKYSDAENGVVVIEHAHHENQLRLRVKDNGIGIPAKDQAALFQPFHRAQNVGTISGMGLGLSIVRQAVQNYGGDVHVNSETGIGTTFTVSIPVKQNKPVASLPD